MRSKDIPTQVRYVAVALLFALCSVVCVPHFLSEFPFLPSLSDRMLPLPFALLCAVLFLRTWRLIFAVPLMFGVWFVSVGVGFYVGVIVARYSLSLLPGCAGGLIGGVGLVLCVATCYPRLFSWRQLLRGAAVGAVGAFPFTFWVAKYFDSNSSSATVVARPLLLCAFVIWQVTVGTYLYAICTEANRNIQPC
ncbi:MAG: hypothetical protein WCA20_08805 [Candidatus Sulfotelmatobacter sp.]